MAITATIARGYALRLIIIGGLCTVFGIWGIIDYSHRIPQRQEYIARLDLLTQCRDALETEQPAGVLSPEAQAASDAVKAELRELTGGEPLTTDHLDAMGDKGTWLGVLVGMQAGLTAERGRPLTREAYPQAFAAHALAETAIVEIGDVTAPGKYDRLIQWAFIACLPFGPYLFWGFARTRRQVYRLDDDGTLHLPEGTWEADDIADIDMSRWMAKSTAWVVNRDGTRVLLDDYKFKNLHLIVGKIAHRLKPDEWDEEARPRKDSGDNAEAGGGDAGGGAEADVADDANHPIIETTGSSSRATTPRDG